MAIAIPGSAYSDYIVFIDESGDHGLKSIDANYPVFVLCAALFNRREYIEAICPALNTLKMDFWGHDEVILHEHDIRKPKNQFAFLQDVANREEFQEKLSGFLAWARFKLVFSVIHKDRYVERYQVPRNPYDVAMSFVLERVFLDLHSKGQTNKRTKVIVECRGANEDAQLGEAFARIGGGENACGRPLPFDLLMIPKLSNSIGLQIADLCARPMGIRSLRPNQANRAYEIIAEKIRRDQQGRAEGWGVKVSP
ncbi:DUF3800 domain-containing protein [Dyella kyungheensis]|uniref:DUF3800 domain-containing protein n=1 Tax=Dyella kyungheensis TaxID=1242174 RepID=A0ABS2JQ04_9GAMM|nr:DUF3800 domain-containing protein [Dyella kyungheensis]MBM7121008.1 DUF3800 domain-containing protein [Dyella kyungheensis]